MFSFIVYKQMMSQKLGVSTGHFNPSKCRHSHVYLNRIPSYSCQNTCGNVSIHQDCKDYFGCIVFGNFPQCSWVWKNLPRLFERLTPHSMIGDQLRTPLNLLIPYCFDVRGISWNPHTSVNLAMKFLKGSIRYALYK